MKPPLQLKQKTVGWRKWRPKLIVTSAEARV